MEGVKIFFRDRLMVIGCHKDRFDRTKLTVEPGIPGRGIDVCIFDIGSKQLDEWDRRQNQHLMQRSQLSRRTMLKAKTQGVYKIAKSLLGLCKDRIGCHQIFACLFQEFVFLPAIRQRLKRLHGFSSFSNLIMGSGSISPGHTP